MNEQEAPRHLLIQARGDDSPLFTSTAGFHAVAPDDFTTGVPVADPALVLPESLVHGLFSWNAALPPEGPTAKAALRKHVKTGLGLAQSLARHLGPQWVVRYWDARQDTAKFVCWGCARLHWTLESHGTPPHPLHMTMMAEYHWGPFRAEGFGDFMPDDPAAALDLPDDLVDDLYTWAGDHDAGINRYVEERDEDRHHARCVELERIGEELAQRVARALKPGRTVTYAGLA
ncbi:hypothetical protein SAMN05428945_5554 [Streptomyces sp. 2224.1]|nr:MULTISPECIES: hypothetical protein [unclassified Streptomyces]SDQ69695.1 hypothetical protein SAMN05216511_0274 [Streptomyces sp. KS_16]SED40113.1 hypothetical protein SAMN05428954_0234 [Streptomyces sp. 2112.3]SED79477.1 hypothetical protein SAMN05428945_5554 [Streptomyces sp. 2224.1]SEE11967.1 hypothetical protein SAMN05428940_7004 [Streptomyces sp. 2133.1]SNC74043.1 hypothetical protein SAMN06272741_6908 [Streptomyces sp. 2114.4]